MKTFTEMTLTNKKKWDLIRYIKQQETYIFKLHSLIETMYHRKKLTNKEDELLTSVLYGGTYDIQKL